MPPKRSMTSTISWRNSPSVSAGTGSAGGLAGDLGGGQSRHQSEQTPVAIQVWLLIRILGFVLFELYAKVHRKIVRLGGQTLTDLCEEIFQALARWAELEPLWSG